VKAASQRTLRCMADLEKVNLVPRERFFCRLTVLFYRSSTETQYTVCQERALVFVFGT